MSNQGIRPNGGRSQSKQPESNTSSSTNGSTANTIGEVQQNLGSLSIQLPQNEESDYLPWLELRSKNRRANVDPSNSFVCLGCNQRFRDWAKFVEHERESHLQDKRQWHERRIPDGYPCEKCGIKYDVRAPLTKHEYKCFKCQFNYSKEKCDPILEKYPGIRRFVELGFELRCPVDMCYTQQAFTVKTGGADAFLEHIFNRHKEFADELDKNYLEITKNMS